MCAKAAWLMNLEGARALRGKVRLRRGGTLGNTEHFPRLWSVVSVQLSALSASCAQPRSGAAFSANLQVEEAQRAALAAPRSGAPRS